MSQTNYDYVMNVLPLLWRRRRVICVGVLAAAGIAFSYFAFMGERYEAYALLRVGEGIKEKPAGSGPFGDGVDLASRIDSLSRIGTTDHVIRQAALQVGFERLLHEGQQTLSSRAWDYVTGWMHATPALASFLPPSSAPEKGSEPDQILIETLRTRISARQEGRSDLLRISFRDLDPVVAADFMNQLANSLVANYADLVLVPGAQSFFQQQTKRLEMEAEKAAADLQAFSVAASIYAVADQRMLLLKRANDLSATLATTRGTIEEKTGQKQAILDQLLALRPVYQSKSVTGIVKSLAGPESRDNDSVVSSSSGYLAESPPLLLVRAYQDNIASLMKVGADLNGARKLEKLLGEQIEHVNAELAALSSKEAEYNRLKRVLARASSAAENYGAKTIEEQVNSDIAKRAQLSSVRVVQLAQKPIIPVFPQISHLVLLAILGGLGLGSAAVVLLEAAKRPSDRRRTGYERSRVRVRGDYLQAVE